MSNQVGIPSQHGLEKHGLVNLNLIHWNLSSPALVERIVQRGEGLLAHLGPVVVRTGHHTGRSPNDKFVIPEPGQEDAIWWGATNKRMSLADFDRLVLRMAAYYQGRDVFVQDAAACSHPDYQMPIRVVTETAWHNLFARNMFVRLPTASLGNHVPQLTILHAPRFHAVPEQDGTNSEVFIVLNLARRMVIIGGSSYAGEIKKAVFTALNYLLPRQGVLSMHCSANVGENGGVALFFGLSGTGKTTLSSDPERRLIGDDEHGWGDDGVFNLEGGCYAKAINLRAELEPVIWEATRRFATVLENVTLDTISRRVDFDDASLTENTRAAYPIGFVENHVAEGRGGHPTDVFFLTADAAGVLPPIARLTPEQASFYFLSGYTSKLAGTEKGMGVAPLPTFSACFGAPFLPLPPSVYSELLVEKLARHKPRVWLVNTGWTGGAYGTGERIRLPYTRAMIRAALGGALDEVPMRNDPYFGLSVPQHCPDVPDSVLDPRSTWPDPAAYDAQAQALADKFARNFAAYADQVDAQVVAAGPRLAARG